MVFVLLKVSFFILNWNNLFSLKVFLAPVWTLKSFLFYEPNACFNLR